MSRWAQRQRRGTTVPGDAEAPPGILVPVLQFQAPAVYPAFVWQIAPGEWDHVWIERNYNDEGYEALVDYAAGTNVHTDYEMEYGNQVSCTYRARFEVDSILGEWSEEIYCDVEEV